MSNVRLTLPAGDSVCNGKQLSFRAPCSCNTLEYLVIGDSSYQLVDTRGVAVSTARGQVFSSGSMVSVILDTVNSKAYVQGPSLPTIALVRW